MFNLLRTTVPFSIIATPFSIPTSNVHRLLFFCVFVNSHPNMWEMVSRCGFDLHFPNDW